LLVLVSEHLTPDPSPARTTDNKIQALIAGEGSIEERGWSPLSSSFPLSNIIKMEAKDSPV